MLCCRYLDPATWGLIEGNEAQTIGHQLEVMLKNTLLQILKNTLIAIIQREVVTWIQGSGARASSLIGEPH